jgi:hypothetical protein
MILVLQLVRVRNILFLLARNLVAREILQDLIIFHHLLVKMLLRVRWVFVMVEIETLV